MKYLILTTVHENGERTTVELLGPFSDGELVRFNERNAEILAHDTGWRFEIEEIEPTPTEEWEREQGEYLEEVRDG